MFAAIMMGLAINSMAYAENNTTYDVLPTTNDVEIMRRWMDENDVNNMNVNEFRDLTNGFGFAVEVDGKEYTIAYDVDFELFGHTILDHYTVWDYNVFNPNK